MNLMQMNLDNIVAIVPVLNEEDTIAAVVLRLQDQGLQNIRVVDNGSTDQSQHQAHTAGAEVLSEPHGGYGQACWRGLQDLPPEIEWILFCDGDGSDDLSQLPQFFENRDRHDLILGDRTATVQGRNVLTPVQRFGNRLATGLIYWGWGYAYRDLGPLRLIRRSALEKIAMQDRAFGWTVEMQVRAVELGLRICELPVAYAPRQGGQSKISGTLIGSFKAGRFILGTLAQLYGRRLPQFPHWLWLSTLFLVLGCILMQPYGNFRDVATLYRFWIGAGVMGLGYMLSWPVKHLSAGWFWGVALLARLLLFPMLPGDDLWRYLWEGHIQNLGFNPFQLAPNAPELVALRTVWWPQINHLDVSAIYPPLTQVGFRWLAALSLNVSLFKAAFVLADVGVCWLLWRRFGAAKSLLYGWNPIILYSFAGGAHYDSWFILPLVAAWLVVDRKPRTLDWLWSAVLVGVSVAIKWMSLPMLGFLMWRSLLARKLWQTVCIGLAGLLPMALFALPFCRVNSCPLVPTSSVFVSYGRSAEFLPHFVAQVWPYSLKANWIFGVPLGFYVIWLGLRSKRFQPFAEGYWFGLLLLTPIIHFWYFAWMIPFAVPSQNWGVRWASLSAFVYFVLPSRLPDWRLTEAERLLLWLPFVLGWLWSVWRTSRDRSKILGANELS
jgi:glycosyltransferase involved in cell wall biosynthesis